MLSQITSEPFWQKVVGSLAEINLSRKSKGTIEEKKEKSPSTAIFIFILLRAIKAKLQSTETRINTGNPKPVSVQVSDYADFLHAIYAPYFDVFRCDSRTAELLSNHNTTKGRIAAKRSDLINMLST